MATLSFVYGSFYLQSNLGVTSGQLYVNEGLHTHVLPIHQTVGNNFIFQHDNSSMPAVWQGTVAS